MRTPVVGRRVASGQVDQPQVRIKGRRRPDIGGAARVGLPLRRQFGNRRIAEIPGPDQFAGDHIKGADHAGGFGDLLIIGHPAADDDAITNHRGHRGLEVEPLLDRPDAGGQVDLAIDAEARARRAGFGIQRQEFGVDRGGDDPAFAKRRGRCGRCGRHRDGWLGCRCWLRHDFHDGFGCSVCSLLRRRRQAGERHLGLGSVPVSHAATPIPEEGFDLGIVAPDFLAGIGVQRDHHIGRRTEKYLVADLHRRVLVFRAAVFLLAGAEGPGDFQLIDIFAVDLVDGGVARSAGVTAVVAPVRAGLGRRRAIADLRRDDGLSLRERVRNGQTQDREARHRRQCRGRSGLPTQGGLSGRGQHQQQEDAQHRGGHQPRDQRPVDEAGFPDRPGQGRGQDGGIHKTCGGMAPDQQHPGGDHARSRQKVIGRAVQENQPAATAQQRQPDESNQPTPDRRPDPGRPACLLVGRHSRSPRLFPRTLAGGIVAVIDLGGVTGRLPQAAR